MRILIALFFLCLASTGALAQFGGGCYQPGSYDPDADNGSALLDLYGNCAAPTSIGSGSSEGSTRLYVGLSVPLGEDFNPHLVAGVQALKFNGENGAAGVEANISVSLQKWLEDTQVHLLAVGGYVGDNFDVLGNAGFGYDFASQSFVLTGGVQVPFARVYADFGLNDQQIRAFLELNSLGKLSSEAAILACDNSRPLLDGAGVLEAFARDNYSLNSPAQGTIFNGTVDYEFGDMQYFSGSPGSGFVDGVTCFISGQPG